MKINIEGKPPIIIGKRVTVGAMITSIGAIFAHYYPYHAPAIVAATVPVTMIFQIIIANWIGVTSSDVE